MHNFLGKQKHYICAQKKNGKKPCDDQSGRNYDVNQIYI